MYSTILKKFHNDSLHQGTTKTELRIKSHVYWPGITTAIKHMISRCNSCPEFQWRLAKPLHSEQIVSAHPMETVNCDIFEKHSKLFHLMVDHFSNYVWVKTHVPSDWTCSVWSPEVDIQHIWYTKHTISDCATYSMGEVFEQFCNKVDIQPKPTNPQSQHQNGKAERFVSTIKDMMYKADNTSLQGIITVLHDTPYSNEIQSPYRLMFNHTVKCNNLPTMQTAKEIVRKTVPAQELPPLKSDQVFVLEWPQDRIAHWKPAQITTENRGEVTQSSHRRRKSVTKRQESLKNGSRCKSCTG